ncbi:MAG: hypothetical protein AB1414_07680 [bacterium]
MTLTLSPTLIFKEKRSCSQGVGTKEDENGVDGSGEIRLKLTATSIPESRTPSPESRFSGEVECSKG